MQLLEAVAAFCEDESPIEGAEPPHECTCDHQLQNTGAVFYQGVGLLHCSICRGWQAIRKGVK